jgi:putative cardiolipin synthase
MVQMLDLPFALARQDIGTLIWAKASVLYDPLDKATGWNESRDSLAGTVTGGVIAWLHTARSDIKMVSPYFIPSPASAESLVQARSKGVSVTVVTNSLASTDVPWVYGAYSPYLKELLGAGVQVFELSPSLGVERARLGIFGDRSAALHMKSAIIDHAQVFLGSMNLDPRSALLNTELGLIIESPEMARRLDAFADADSWYRLRLNPADDRVQWIRDNADGTQTLFDVPPETTLWQRLELRLVGPFVPVSDL